MAATFVAEECRLYDFSDTTSGVDERNKVGIGRSHQTTFNTDPDDFYDIYMSVATNDNNQFLNKDYVE